MSVRIEIKSRPGTFITLDKEVADKIGAWGWHINADGYVIAHLSGRGRWRKKVMISRAVIWAVTGKWPEKGKEVDHINHDLLDNRMENLRVVTPSLNQRNKLKQEGTSSKYHGVYLHKVTEKWIAEAGVRTDGKLIQIRSSSTTDEILAAKCADCIRDLIGGFIPRNFPDLTFFEKWTSIGVEQRRQIRSSMVRNEIPVDPASPFFHWETKAA